MVTNCADEFKKNIPSFSLINFTKSLLFCQEGKFLLFGIPVIFSQGKNEFTMIDKVKRILKTTYLGTLIHELGHTVAYKIFTNNLNPVCIQIDSDGSGLMRRHMEIHLIKGKESAYVFGPGTKLGETIELAAGPVFEFVFYTGKILTALACQRFISFPLAWIIAAQELVTMSKALNCYIESDQSDDTDYCKIKTIAPEYFDNALIPLRALHLMGKLALTTSVTKRLCESLIRRVGLGSSRVGLVLSVMGIFAAGVVCLITNKDRHALFVPRRTYKTILGWPFPSTIS